MTLNKDSSQKCVLFQILAKLPKLQFGCEEKSTEKEGGLARINAIEHEWVEDWFT